MKQFVFSLEPALQIRRQQLEIERSRLASLIAQMKMLEAERDALEAQRAESSHDLHRCSTLQRHELFALNQYEIGLRKKSERLSAHLSQLRKQFHDQRTRVISAGRNERLLVELKKKQRASWDAEYSRELDLMVGDFFNSKLVSARRAASKQVAEQENDSPI